MEFTTIGNAKDTFIIIFSVWYLLCQLFLAFGGFGVALYGRGIDSPETILVGDIMAKTSGAMYKPMKSIVGYFMGDAGLLFYVLAWVNAVIIAYVIFVIRYGLKKYVKR